MTLDASSGTETLTPKLVTVVREGYTLSMLRRDLVAASTVAIVALPLSMAIAIASGVSPERGLYAAIVGGFIISALGGSRFQIGGPAGAFIVLVSTTVTAYGLDGLVLVTAMAGVLMVLGGVLRVGRYVRLIPPPVIVGFTAAIAVVIFLSQLRDAFGLRLEVSEPSSLWPKLIALWKAAGTVNVAALLLSVSCVASIQLLRNFAPRVPSLLVVVASAAVLVAVADLPLETIATRFGRLPNELPWPGLPDVTWGRAWTLLPIALTFALLGAIESLLSALVADDMTGRRHRSDGELIAQGVANVGSALFGGLTVTGTIARTATNVRAGAVSPVSGMLHSVILLVMLLAAGTLVTFVPLAALAAVLVTVAWNMADRAAIGRMLRRAGPESLVFATTLMATLCLDLLWGIGAGTLLSFILKRARA